MARYEALRYERMQMVMQGRFIGDPSLMCLHHVDESEPRLAKRGSRCYPARPAGGERQGDCETSARRGGDEEYSGRGDGYGGVTHAARRRRRQGDQTG